MLFLLILQLNTCNARRQSGMAKLIHSRPKVTRGDPPSAGLPHFGGCVKRGLLADLRRLLFECAIRISTAQGKKQQHP